MNDPLTSSGSSSNVPTITNVSGNVSTMANTNINTTGNNPNSTTIASSASSSSSLSSSSSSASRGIGGNATSTTSLNNSGIIGIGGSGSNIGMNTNTGINSNINNSNMNNINNSSGGGGSGSGSGGGNNSMMVINKKPSIFDEDLNVHMHKSVSLSAFSHVYCELLQYCQSGILDIGTLENRLSEIGYQIGIKQLELITHRSKPMKREINHVNMLEFITKECWKQIFGKPADGLEQSMQNENEFFIVDHKPITNRYISVPEDLGTFNPASFIAGIIHGILEGSGFKCNVIALDQESNVELKRPKRTLFIVQFKHLQKV